MNNRSTRSPSEATGVRWSLGASVAAAVGASVCCIGPLILLALGISGAWAGTLTALDPLRPLFVAVAVVALGFAFYSVYRPSAGDACGSDGRCRNPRLLRRRRVGVWGAAVIVSALVTAPYLTERLLATEDGDASAAPESAALNQAVLSVDNITCAACTVSVQRSLLAVGGVHEAQVTHQPPQAVVRYELGRVSLEDITRATADAGYPSRADRAGVEALTGTINE